MTSLTGVRLIPTVGERGSVNASGRSLFSTPTWETSFVMGQLFNILHPLPHSLQYDG